jgi:hypothetical protein
MHTQPPKAHSSTAFRDLLSSSGTPLARKLGAAIAARLGSGGASVIGSGAAAANEKRMTCA